MCSKSLRGAHVVIYGAIGYRHTEEIHIGQLGDGHIPCEVDSLLEVLHGAAMGDRLPDAVAAFARIDTADGLVNAGVGRGIILQMDAAGKVPLQAVVALPCELFEVCRLHDDQRGALVAEHGLFVVAVYLGVEGEVLGLVAEVEVLDELGILAVDEFRLRLGEGRHLTLFLRGEGVGEGSVVLVFVVVRYLVIRRAFTAVSV